MRCCANCEWCFTADDEEYLENESRLRNGGILKEEEITSHAGDCVIGQQHDQNYYCSSHIYREGYEKISLMYDEKYLGPGFLIMVTVNDELDKFIKISLSNTGGVPQFCIRGYEKNKKDTLTQQFRTIRISITEDESLFIPFNHLAQKLNEQKIYSIDSYYQGKNHMQIINNGDTTIELHKDVFGVKHATDFIDIVLGDNDTCLFYKELLDFYHDLSNLFPPSTTENDIKKLLLK